MPWKPRLLSLIIVGAAGAAGACGGTTPPGSGPDAGIDAPVATYAGTWRLTSVTIGSDAGPLTVTDENQHLTDPTSGEMHDYRVNGTLELNAAGEFAYVQQRVVDDTIPLTRVMEAANFITKYTPTGTDSGTFALAGGLPTVGFVWQQTPAEKLDIQLDSVNKLELQRFTPGSTDTFQVRGTITLADGTPTFHSPHVSIAFLLRNGFAVDPRDDKHLDFTGTNTTTFQLDRIEGALGVQRIVYGTNTAIAVGLIVVWDDLDDDNQPGATLFDKCASPPTGGDCLRGVAPVYLTARSGSSAELSASPFAFVRPGWTQSIFVQDLRPQLPRNGVVSLDSTLAVPFDVYVPSSPLQTFVPVFDF
jgi:hypothetical protein